MPTDLITIVIMLAPAILAVANWLISLIVVRNEPHVMIRDLKRLVPASKPFVKTQWPFLVFSIVACGLSAISHTLEHLVPAAVPVTAILNALASFIIPVLGIFYVTYLASDKYPGLLSTVGVATLIKYFIVSSLRSYFSLLGIFALIIPGVNFYVRTCLFLPVYMCEGQRVTHALDRSWKLTKGKYWRISRYLGFPVMVQLLLSAIPTAAIMFSSLHAKDGTVSSLMQTVYAAAPSVCLGLSVIVDLIIIGLSFRLYEELSAIDTESAK